jgi:hypothetical protein
MSKKVNKDNLGSSPTDETMAIRPSSTTVTSSVSTEELLRQYEAEMKASGAKKEVLTWHLIILDNFIRNFMVEHGVAVIRLPKTNR